jgi:hypothetical protein
VKGERRAWMLAKKRRERSGARRGWGREGGRGDKREETNNKLLPGQRITRVTASDSDPSLFWTTSYRELPARSATTDGIVGARGLK